MTAPGGPVPSYAAPRPKARPRARWFVVGGTLLVLAAVAFGLLLALTVTRSTRTDAVPVFTSPGQAVDVTVPAGERRMLFVRDGASRPTCTLRDARGRDVGVRPVGADVTVTTGGTRWRGTGTFTSRTSTVRLSCPDVRGGGVVRVGAPLGAGFALGLVATIAVPLLLGGAGAAVLVTTTVLWFTRAPRATH